MEEKYEKLKKYFDVSDELFDKLIELDKKKKELRELREKNGRLSSPIIITVTGTPRSGKTTCITNLFEFFRKANFKTAYVAEPAGLVYDTLKDKKEKEDLLKQRVKFVDKQYDIGLNKINQCMSDNNDIIICDRGIIDTFIWYDMYYKMGLIDKNQYENNLLKSDIIIVYSNYFYALKSSPEEAMKRDYINSLCLDPRSTVNENFIEKYNSSLEEMYVFFKDLLNGSKMIDTTNLKKMDASIEIAQDMTEKIKKLYK